MTEEKKVLALKYRPKRFEDLVGQDTISQTLSLALDTNRLSHAYLFSGLRGSGKTSTARIMAKALLCTTGPTSKPCETCDNCLSANANRHLDIIEMDAASNRGIDDIKDLIEHTKYKPSSARFKVFIIDEVHMLTTQAFNALLKTLEEPPGFVKFILATTDALKLPATILSRTQHFRFKKISNKDVIHHLSHILNEEGIDFEEEALAILSRSGQGSLRDTLTLLDQAIIFSKGMVSTSSVVEMLGLIDPKFMDEIFDLVLSNSDVTAIAQSLENYEISSVCDEMSIYLKNKMFQRDPKFDLLIFDRYFRIIADSKHLLALNSDSSFVLILMLLKMIEANNLRSINDIINDVKQVEVKKDLEHVNNISASLNEEKIIEHSHEASKEVVNESVQELYHEKKDNIDNSSNTIIQENPSSNETLDLANNQVQENEVLIKEQKDEILGQEIQAVEEIQVNHTEQVPKVQEPVPLVANEDFVQGNVNSLNSPSSPTLSTVQTLEKPIVQEEKKVEVKDEGKVKFELVINRVYDRDVELGEVFEDNFIYKNFNNNTLNISSFAQGDQRKLLFKHFGIIKTFIYDIYGKNIEIDFLKEEPR